MSDFEGGHPRPSSFLIRSVVFLALVGLLVLAPPCLAVELFGPRLGLRTGDGPSHTVVADFDDNGVQDFAAVNFHDGTVSVILGDGLGGFEVVSAVPVPPGVHPTSVAAGDFDLDDDVDLAVVSPITSTVTVLIGDGTGAFASGPVIPSAGGPGFVVAGDFNFDGAADLALANNHSDSVTVMLGDGAGGFTVADTVLLEPGSNPHFIAIADLDNDGNADLAVANSWANSVSILDGDGTGTFQRVADVYVGDATAPSALVAGDFDLDGRLDLGVANGADDSVSIVERDENGNYGVTRKIPLEEETSTADRGPAWIDAADLNADGALDLVVANLTDHTVAILRGDGAGRFVLTPDIVVQDNPRSVTIGEFTGDGALDLAVVVAGSDLVTVLPGDGLGGFARTKQITDLVLNVASWGDLWAVTCVEAANFDGDQHTDLAVTSFQDDSVSIFLGDGQGNFDEQSKTRIEVISPGCMAVDDLNGDGILDLAVTQNNGQNAVQVLHGRGDGTFSEGQRVSLECFDTGPFGCDVVWAESGDLDGDGDPDLVVGDADAGLRILTQDAAGAFHETRRYGGAPIAGLVEDFNGDGVLDVAASVDYSTSVMVYLGDGTAAFSGPYLRIDAPASIARDYPFQPASFGPALGSAGEVSGIVELVDDGVTEFTDSSGTYRPEGTTTDACQPLLNDLTGRFALVDRGHCRFDAKVTNAQAAGAAAVIVVNQYDNLFLMRGSSNGINIPCVGISRGDGDVIESALPGVHAKLGSPGDDRIVTVGEFPESIATGDFNGDHVPDLATGNRWGNTVSIALGTGSGGFAQVREIPVGERVRAVAVADINLDGLDDLAFALGGDDTVGVLINDGQGDFSRTPDFHSGREPYSVALADFDSDGAPDLAAANARGDSVSILFNRVAGRVDPNGSNRVDGFDVAEIGRLWGATTSDAPYRRTHDVDLNGVIDGDDLTLVADRFGELMNVASPLRPLPKQEVPSTPDTVTLQWSDETDADLLTLDVLVNDDDDAASSAEFVVKFEPEPQDPDRSPVLEWVGFDPGDYFLGGLTQAYDLDPSTPERVSVRAERLPSEDRPGTGAASLLSLRFRAVRRGTAVFEFDASEGQAEPALLDGSGNRVAGVDFVGGLDVLVDTTDEEAVGQRIGFAPPALDFGDVVPGGSTKKRLRVSNFGYSDLTVLGVQSSSPEFLTLFTSEFTIPPFGSVELPVRFAPSVPGVFGAELIIRSDDPGEFVRVPVSGGSAPSLSVSQSHIDFGGVPAGGVATRRIGIGNRGNAPFLMTGISEPDTEGINVQATFTLLNPGEIGYVDVDFRPTAAGPLHETLVVIFGGAERTTVTISLSGVAQATP